MADHHWPTPTQATSLAQGRVLGACNGRSTSEIIITIADDGVSVLDVETLEILQSWAFQEEEGCEPVGPASFQKNGGVFCVPMRARSVDKPSTRRTKQDVSSDFLYVWNMSNVESKNIRHVSTKVELSSSVGLILPLVCHARTFVGDRHCLKTFSKGFLVLTEDGIVNVLNTETSRLEAIDLPHVGNGILSADCHENGVTLVYSAPQGKKKKNDLYIERLSFGEYPSLHRKGTWKLNIEDDASPLRVTCKNNKAVLVFSNGTVLVYDIPDISSDDTLSPLFSRRLQLDSSAGQQKGKKRGGAGAPSLDGDLRVFIDSFSRAFICRHDDKSLLKIATLDLLYGSILWVGSVERNSPKDVVSQAIMFGEESVDVCLAIQGSRIIKIAADVPKATLASVVGSMCIQNTVTGNESAKLNPLALNARLVLDSDSLGEMNESKSLGKVTIDVTPIEGFGWVKPASKVIWEPSIKEEFEQHEKKLASMVRTRGKRHDSKSRSEFLKAVTIGLNMCKTSDVSFSGEISAGILTTLIDLKQWDSIGSLLLYSHPRSMAHCPGAASSLSENARYIELFALLRHASDISSRELYAVIKSLISASGPDYEATSKVLMSSLSSNADEQIRKAEGFKASNGEIQINSELVNAARMSAAPIHGFSRKQLVCHPLLALYPNPVLLCTAMKRLHSQSLLYLIHYLHRWFKNILDLNVTQGGESPTCDVAFVPSLNTVMKWLVAALDAGNLRLSTIGTGIDVLKKLHDDLQVYSKSFEALGELSGMLEHIEKSRQSKTPQRRTTQGFFTSEYFSL